MIPAQEDDEPDTRTVQEWLEDEVVPLIDAWEEDRYPVIIEYTERKLVWVEADSAANAVRRMEGDSEWYERMPGATTLGYTVAFEKPDSWEWHGGPHSGDAVYCEEFGPKWQCPTCKWSDLQPRWAHKVDCPDRPGKR